MDEQRVKNVTLGEQLSRAAHLKHQHTDQMRQLRDMKVRVEEAEAACDEAVAKMVSAVRQSKEHARRAVMAQEKIKIHERRVAGHTAELQQLQTTIRSLHTQLLRWCTVRLAHCGAIALCASVFRFNQNVFGYFDPEKMF